jgi:hypothetical protein
MSNNERRSLVEGLKATPSKIDPELEKTFVFGSKEAPPAEPLTPPKPNPSQSITRSPLSTRIRSDLSTSLKRASLERELANTQPHTVQDILEEALSNWLSTHGY